MTQANIETLGILEQNLSSLLLQRQTIQKELLDIKQATSELESATDAYHIVGTVMIKKSAKELQESLQHKSKHMTIKLESVQKQEEALRKQLKSMQDEVMKNLKQGE